MRLQWMSNSWIAYKDKETLKAWELGQIDTVTAWSELCDHNEWDPANIPATAEELEKLFNSLGYLRESI